MIAQPLYDRSETTCIGFPQQVAISDARRLVGRSLMLPASSTYLQSGFDSPHGRTTHFTDAFLSVRQMLLHRSLTC